MLKAKNNAIVLLLVIKIIKGTILLFSRISMFFRFLLCFLCLYVRVLHWWLEMLTHRNACTLWLLLLLHVAGSAFKFNLFSESSETSFV